MRGNQSRTQWNDKKIRDYRHDRIICVRVMIVLASMEATLIIFGFLGDVTTAIYCALIVQLCMLMVLVYVLSLSVEIRWLEKSNDLMKEL